MKTLKAVPFLFLLSVNPSMAQEQVQDYFLCKKKAEVRSLRTIKDNQNFICYYTKSGVDEVVGQSRSSEMCRNILEQIRGNLTKVSWNCKEVTASKVTSDAGTVEKENEKH